MPNDLFRVTSHNAEGEFITDAIMGPNSLRIELDYLPVGWKLTIVRTESATVEEESKANG